MADVPLILFVNEAVDANRRRFGEALAAQLGLSIAPPSEPARPRAGLVPASPLQLVISDERLELRTAGDRPGRGLFVDWTDLSPRRVARSGGFSRRQPLARAIGKDTQTVLDATAGLGHDAALLACMGFRVLAVERSPIIFALLEDGLRRAMDDAELCKALGGRLTILHADAREALRSHPADAVYIDPMFPPKRKASALAKKSIRLVRQIVGDDEDAAELLATARQHVRRVIVKRPTHAAPHAPNPTASITGKLVRYDMYVNERKKMYPVHFYIGMRG